MGLLGTIVLVILGVIWEILGFYLWLFKGYGFSWVILVLIVGGAATWTYAYSTYEPS